MLHINISKHIEAEEGKTDLTINSNFQKGRISAIFGNSGQGKSTLFNVISGIISPEKGIVKNEGESWFDSENKVNLAIQKRNVGYIFQTNSLFPNFTVKENILYAVSKKNHQTVDLDSILNQMGLVNLANKYPHELSGGQIQRAAIARTLAQKSKLILMDEPFSGLDMEIKHNLYKEIKKFRDELGLTILIITHDIYDIYYLCDDVHWMRNHSLEETISVESFKTEIEKRIEKL